MEAKVNQKNSKSDFRHTATGVDGADFEFYKKDGVDYCRFRFGEKVFDASINDIYAIALGLGLAVLTLFLILRNQYLKIAK